MGNNVKFYLFFALLCPPQVKARALQSKEALNLLNGEKQGFLIYI